MVHLLTKKMKKRVAVSGHEGGKNFYLYLEDLIKLIKQPHKTTNQDPINTTFF